MDTEDQKEDIKPFHFHQLGVDSRLLQAIEKLRWKEPTLIQEKTIPLFLKGKDIAVRAKTGSGKTAAYLLAILHRILEIKLIKDFKHTSAVILAPSRDLCKQVTQNIEELTIFCQQEISCVDLSLEHTNMKKKSFKFTNADIIVGTPLNALNWAKNTNSKSKQNIQYVVIDEADLMFTYGYKDDLHNLLTSLSGSAQLFLLSATLSEEVDYLSKKFSRLPVIVRLEEPPLPPEQQLTQYIIKGPVNDKPLLLVVLFRLDLLQGKTLIFVDSIHKGYKLQMFLTMFGVQSRVLNNELPLNLRLHHVDEFNKNVFKILIATDVSSVTNVKKEEDDKTNLNTDSSAARGIDFQGLTTVLNYDVPHTTGAYIHRVGRTARAGRRGNALVFVAPQEVERFKRIEEDLRLLNATTDASSSTGIALGNSPFKDFNFDFSSLDGFRYRVMDAWHDCTDQAVKRARAAELKNEILNSKKLKSFLQYNPTDKISLQTLFNKNSPVITKPHLLHIPEYNVPESLRRVAEASKSIKKAKNETEGSTRENKTKKKKQRGNAWKPKDPLQSFDYNPQKK